MYIVTYYHYRIIFNICFYAFSHRLLYYLYLILKSYMIFICTGIQICYSELYFQ